MKTRQRKPVLRNPVAMVIAGLILLFGTALTIAGFYCFSSFGWPAILIVIAGLINVGSALMTLITGKVEFILLDLILPS